MKKLLVLAALLLSLTALVSPAKAETKPYADVGGWSVGYNSDANGCALKATWSPSQLRLETGFIQKDGETEKAYISISNKNWSWVTKGAFYDVKLTFYGVGSPPREETWNGKWKGLSNNLLFIVGLTTKFYDHFSEADGFTLTIGGKGFGGFKLPGSRAAYWKALACQNSMSVLFLLLLLPKRNPKKRKMKTKNLLVPDFL